ncbi:MAG: hypothetical protein IT312_04640 [Anaerolineales bacterium]|nr:hypothetical protein [Anaerolineales bacterium]
MADKTQTPVVTTPPIIATETFIPVQSPTIPLPTATPTFISASLPSDLVVAYILEDALWVWNQGNSQLLLQQENIYAPKLSDDGQWILFIQHHMSLDENLPYEELWVVRTDGSELHRLLGPDELVAATGESRAVFIFDAEWMPSSHKILFNTERVIEGPPGSVPVFDLYSLDMTGQVNRLAEAGSGGRFSISPTGTHVALTTNSRIAVLDLKTNKQITLLEYKPLLIPSEIMFIASVTWDPQGRFIATSIPPEKMHYSDYAGEPVQVWRLFVNGQAELIAEFQPYFPNPRVSFSPNLQYFLYLKNTCLGKWGTLTLHIISSASEISLIDCTMELPAWIPDNEHFYLSMDGLWQLGSINNATYQPIDFLNVSTAPNVHIPPQLTWINDEYFLLTLRSVDACTLTIATLQGIVAEIARTLPKICPRGIAFSLSR